MTFHFRVSDLAERKVLIKIKNKNIVNPFHGGLRIRDAHMTGQNPIEREFIGNILKDMQGRRSLSERERESMCTHSFR